MLWAVYFSLYVKQSFFVVTGQILDAENFIFNVLVQLSYFWWLISNEMEGSEGGVTYEQSTFKRDKKATFESNDKDS